MKSTTTLVEIMLIGLGIMAWRCLASGARRLVITGLLVSVVIGLVCYSNHSRVLAAPCPNQNGTPMSWRAFIGSGCDAVRQDNPIQTQQTDPSAKQGDEGSLTAVVLGLIWFGMIFFKYRVATNRRRSERPILVPTTNEENESNPSQPFFG